MAATQQLDHPGRVRARDEAGVSNQRQHRHVDETVLIVVHPSTPCTVSVVVAAKASKWSRSGAEGIEFAVVRVPQTPARRRPPGRREAQLAVR
jgi:hypothetical protein